MSINIEIKALDPNRAATLERCRLLDTVDAGLLHQRDTYFAVARGTLKLREELGSGTAELILYERPADDGIRSSHYVRAPVAGEETRRLLERALPIVGVVEKRRHLFLWNQIRIHLDEVEGLGSFVELEAIVSERMSADEARAAIDVLLKSLEIDPATLEPGGYLELLAAAPS
jgi:adenylate cyclase, class 2